MEDVRWPAKQLEEHRLEISNRIRNLFWTVSGDYDMEFEPDTEKYVYSKQTVLYEAVKQGAFARYFDQKKLGMYLMKKLHFSAGEDILLPLAGLCIHHTCSDHHTGNPQNFSYATCQSQKNTLHCQHEKTACKKMYRFHVFFF